MTGKAKNKGGKKEKGKRSFFVWKCLILIIIFFSIILLYVWGKVELLEAGFEIRERTGRKRKLSEERELLLSEAARLKSPQRLERIAKEELGLIVPTDGKSIRRIVINH
ncbi:septum formation initiator family protein [candidate division NPL-UPA2 bacterium]|nr:septum formation initiator family protein [candidate division NPL-UPA2 bacterium]